MKNLKAVVQKAADLGEGVLDAIVATEDVDRDEERLSIKGLDVRQYQKNPTVLWAHEYNRPPIAKAEKLTKRADGTLTARIKFAIAESEFAREIYNLYKGGYLNAFSIGFIPKEVDGNMFTKSEMLEFSAVPVPANANALTTAKSKGVISEDTFEKLDTEEEEVETKTMTVDTTVLDEALIEMSGQIKEAKSLVKELKTLDRTGASLRQKRIRLVGVRKRMQSVQSTAQAGNRGFAKLKGARSIRRINVKVKR